MAAGDRIYWTDVDEAIEPPCGRLVQTVSQTGIASNTLTAITFTTEDLDTHNFHSTSSNTSQVKPTVAGWYRVHGTASIAGATDYTMAETVIRKNGNALAPATRLWVTTSSSQTLLIPATALVEVNGSTDYFEVAFRAIKGAGTVATVISSQFASVLEWEYVRPS